MKMKLAFAVALVISQADAAATAPQSSLSLTIRDGVYSDAVSGFDPTLRTMADKQINEKLYVTYGYDTEIKQDKNILNWPRLIWGKAVTTAAGWALTCAAEVDHNSQTTVELQADSDDIDAKFRVLASASRDGGVAIDGVEASKGFDFGDNSRMLVTPRYDVQNELADVVFGCDLGDRTSLEVVASRAAQTATLSHRLLRDTDVKLAASKEYQSVAVSQQIDDWNVLTPAVDSDGKVQLEWERTLKGGEGVMTATLKPNEALDVEWRDRDWTAMVQLPMDGASVRETAVTIKRDVLF